MLEEVAVDSIELRIEVTRAGEEGLPAAQVVALEETRELTIGVVIERPAPPAPGGNHPAIGLGASIAGHRARARLAPIQPPTRLEGHQLIGEADRFQEGLAGLGVIARQGQERPPEVRQRLAHHIDEVVAESLDLRQGRRALGHGGEEFCGPARGRRRIVLFAARPGGGLARAPRGSGTINALGAALLLAHRGVGRVGQEMQRTNEGGVGQTVAAQGVVREPGVQTVLAELGRAGHKEAAGEEVVEEGIGLQPLGEEAVAREGVGVGLLGQGAEVGQRPQAAVDAVVAAEVQQLAP